MLHSGRSFPGTPAPPCSTTGTGPAEEEKKKRQWTGVCGALLFTAASLTQHAVQSGQSNQVTRVFFSQGAVLDRFTPRL